MTRNTIFRYSVAMLAAIALVSCDKDGDFLTVSNGDGTQLDAPSDDIVLDYNNIEALCLSLNWNENGELTVSNPAVAVPDNVVTNAIEVALSDDFYSPVTLSVPDGQYYYQFTVGELNSVMSRLGVDGGVRTEVFIRVKTLLAKNVDPTYSNVIRIHVTPYFLDMTVANCLDKNMVENGMSLLSPDADGIYSGFVGVASWENWYLKEATGTIWGNSSTAGTFAIDSENIWNMWYPGEAGCYFTTVNTVDKYWEARLIPSLTVDGDVSGILEFDRKTCEWSMTVNVPAGQKNISISGESTLYNLSTGDGGSSLISTMALVGSSDNLRYSSSLSAISVNVPASGEQKMTLRLVNPLQWEISFGESGETPVEEVSPLLYISGHDDALSGSWHFDHFLRLYSEDDKAYAGGVWFDSKWGYKLYKEAGNWDDAWGAGEEAQELGGGLKFGADTNIPAPEAGLYILDARIGELKYELTAVNDVSYAGLNDDWNPYPMSATDKNGVYTAVVSKTADTPWGVKVLINGSWTVCFGGGDGVLRYGASGFDGDNELADGSYLLTVDLIAGTYSYSEL